MMKQAYDLHTGHNTILQKRKKETMSIKHTSIISINYTTANVKERVDLYLHFHSVPSWPVLGRTLPVSWYLHISCT